MFNVNEYFDGKVKSIAFNAGSDKATVGVMAVGEYEFGTSCIEHMTLVSGMMAIKFPGAAQWQDISVNEMFVVEANTKFQVRISAEASYLCVYK